jgi:2-dehydro-3-deoxygalactonokinase
LNSYLSGLLIGEELRSREPLPESLILIGSTALLQPYGDALASCGVQTRSFDNQASWAGLHAIANATTIPPPTIGHGAA